MVTVYIDLATANTFSTYIIAVYRDMITVFAIIFVILAVTFSDTTFYVKSRHHLNIYR
jgi:hypothetical protein